MNEDCRLHYRRFKTSSCSPCTPMVHLQTNWEKKNDQTYFSENMPKSHYSISQHLLNHYVALRKMSVDRMVHSIRKRTRVQNQIRTTHHSGTLQEQPVVRAIIQKIYKVLFFSH